MTPIEILGQMISILAVIISFVTYQMKSKQKIFITLSVATSVSCVAYARLGGTVALVLNLVSILRNIFFCYIEKNHFPGSKAVPVILALVMGIFSIFTWEGYHSAFFVVGIALNTLAMGYLSPQGLRKSILLTSSLILIYNLFIPSIGGVINELVASTSSVIGLLRYKKATEAVSNHEKPYQTP